MMGCGCQDACTCVFIAGDGISLTRVGDQVTITNSVLGGQFVDETGDTMTGQLVMFQTNIEAQASAANVAGFRQRVTGDPQLRWFVYPDGTTFFGSGSAVVDTQYSRTAPNVLSMGGDDKWKQNTDAVDQDDLTNLRTVEDLALHPAARMFQSANQAGFFATSGTWYEIDFNSVNFDVNSGGMANTATDEFTVQEDGIYHVHGQINFDANAGAVNEARIMRNGSQVQIERENLVTAVNQSILDIDYFGVASAGDTFSLEGRTFDNNVDLNGGSSRTNFSIVRVTK